MNTIALPTTSQAAPRHLFWPLQIGGWCAYFVLNFLVAMGDGRPLSYVLVSLSVALCGFATTSVLRLGYRRLWGKPPRVMVPAAALMLVLATIVQMKLHVIITFRHCEDCEIHSLFGYLWYFASALYLLLSWSGLYFGIRLAQQLQQQKEAALRTAKERGKHIVVSMGDVAASGGYWLACAGDEIWVDDSSIVGSIGVIFASFGFPELMARQGIERRVVTAGKSKSFADPFLPQKPEDIDRLRALQGPIHEAFIAHVKARRGARLAEADLFNADVWVGQQAVDLGLVDGVAHLVPKLKALYGDKVRLVPLGQKRGLLARFGLRLGEDLMQSVEDRALWARYGL